MSCAAPGCRCRLTSFESSNFATPQGICTTPGCNHHAGRHRERTPLATPPPPPATSTTLPPPPPPPPPAAPSVSETLSTAAEGEESARKRAKRDQPKDAGQQTNRTWSECTVLSMGEHLTTRARCCVCIWVAGSVEVFWKELVACKNQPLSLGETVTTTSGGLLTLSNRACIFGQVGVGSKLFIRECYVQIFDSLIKEMVEIEAKAASVNEVMAFGVLIVGTPGIGKSLFLCYAMWRIAQDYPNSTIVYFNSFERRYYLLLSDGSSDSFDRHEVGQILNVLTQPDTFLLFDDEGEEQPPIVNAPTIVVSSSDERQYTNWQKARKLRRYMPAWSLDEILLAHKHIPLYGLVTDVEERFRIVGGVPRFVLDFTVTLEMIEFNAASWIAGCDLDAVLGAANGGFDGGGATGRTAKLINLVASAPAFDQLSRVEWMSSHIASGVVSHYFKNHQAKVVSFLRAASESPRLGVIFGAAFESYAHLCLAQGGPGAFDVRQLGPARGAPSTGDRI